MGWYFFSGNLVISATTVSTETDVIFNIWTTSAANSRSVHSHRITESQITEWPSLGGMSKSHLIQCSCSSRTTWSQLPRTISRWLLNVSKDGNPTIAVGNLCQCSVTLTVKKCFLIFRKNISFISLSSLPLVVSLGTTGKRFSQSSLDPPFRYLCTLRISPWTFCFSG